MRSSTALAVVLSAAALSISPAMAQTSPDTSDPAAGVEQTMPGTSGTGEPSATMPGTTGTGDTQATDPMAADAAAGPAILDQQEGDHQLAEDYIGAKVVARSDEGLEDIGTVADLVLGPDDKIVGVVVDVGGFLGVGAKPVGLSWASLTQEQAEGELLLKTELTRQALEEAPEFQSLADQQSEQAPATGTGTGTGTGMQ